MTAPVRFDSLRAAIRAVSYAERMAHTRASLRAAAETYEWAPYAWTPPVTLPKLAFIEIADARIKSLDVYLRLRRGR